jgi:hypothetical protein
MSAQLCFDFEVAPAPAAPARTAKAVQKEEWQLRDERYWAAEEARVRAYWKPGMVTSLPLFAMVQDIGKRYTQMLPGVIESITGDLAAVRIYAAPEWGCWLENYPLHLALAIDVPLTDLGEHHWHHELQEVVDAGLLATGDAELGARVRARVAKGSEA